MYFFRFNFFSLIKWTLVFCAAMLGLKHSEVIPVWRGKKEMKRPFRKAILIIVLATLAGFVQMHFQHKFYKTMRKLRNSEDTKPAHGDFSNETPKEDYHETEEVVFLNADKSGRNLKGEQHHGEDKRRGDDWERRSDDHHQGRDHHRGRHSKGIKLLFASLLWLAIVIPFLHCFCRFTVGCIKLYKVNKKCNESQRAEVNKIFVERIGEPNTD